MTRHFAIRLIAFTVLALTFGVPPASAQSGFDTMLRQLGERALEEIVRPDPPPEARPSTRPSDPPPEARPYTAPPDSPPVSRPYTPPQRPQAPPAPSGPTRAEVLEVQRLLVELGYDPGVPDGLMGPNTARAISVFQADAGARQTGAVTDGLLSRLRVAAANPYGGEAGTTSRQTVLQPSFDCALASTSTEQAICGSVRLADLDRALSLAYRDRLQDSGNSAQLRLEQRAWLRQRDACGGSASCLEQSMQQRIRALGGSAELAYDSGEARDALSVQERIPVSTALAGGDAYVTLLDRYIQKHPDAARHPDFLPYFAGLGCAADGWGRKQNLNPFELAEIENEAQVRLDSKLAEAGESPAAEQVLVTFRANVTADDYDMANRVFPISSGRSIEANIRPDDFCRSVARARDLRQQSVFPTYFWIAAADGTKLEPSDIVKMLGGKVSIGREAARAFYERGFPTIVVEVTGRVLSLARAEDGVGLVTLAPVQATLRTQGNDRYSRELAVLGPEQIGSLGVISQDEADSATERRFPELSEAALIAAILRDDPDLLETPSIAAQYVYWDGQRGCLPEADLRGKPNPEFVRQDLLNAAPARARDQLGAAPDVRRFSIVDDAQLQEYDIDSRIFSLNLRYSNGRPDEDPERFRYALLNRARIPNCVNADGPELPDTRGLQIRDSGLLDQMAMAPDEAEALVLRNPERAVTVRMDVELEGFSREHGRIQATQLVLLRGQIIDKITGDVLREITLDDVDAARPEPDRWSEIPEITYRQILVRLVQQHPALAEDAAYVRAFTGATACNRLGEAEGNPITMQRLKQEFSVALNEEIASTRAPLMRLVYGRGGYGNAELGDYDLDDERFMFRLDKGGPLAKGSFVVRAYCRGQSLSESPNEIRLEVSGLRGLLEEGLPMTLARAEEFLERYGGRKDGRERRVSVVVIAMPAKMTPANTPEQAEVASGVLEAVTMRIVDPFDDSILHQVGALPDLAEAASSPPEADTAVAEEPHGPSEQVSYADGAQGYEAAEEPLQLLGIRLGMSKDQTRSALADQFAADGIASLESDMLAAEEGPCLYHSVAEASLAEEAGSACALVRFGEDEAANSVMVRNVVPGAQTKALTGMLASRFGPIEERVEASGTVILGWGAPLSSADELDRDLSAGQIPRTLEARISEAQGVTLVTLRLDADPTPAEPQPTTPEIKF